MDNPSAVLERQGIPTTDLGPAEVAKLSVECAKLQLERERVAHSRWWQEDTLVNQRLTWLLQSQTVLLAGYGLLVKGGSGVPSAHPKAVASVVEAFPFIGFAVCILIAMGISAAWCAQRILRDYYAPLGLVIGVSKATTRGGRIPAHGLPFLFVASWGWLAQQEVGAVCALVLAIFLILAVEAWLKMKSKQGLRELRDSPPPINSGVTANPAAQADVSAAA